MRLWVRLDLKVNPSPRFSGAIGCAPNTPEGGVLYQPSAPISGQSDSRGLDRVLLKRKENSSRGIRWRLGVRLRCRAL